MVRVIAQNLPNDLEQLRHPSCTWPLGDCHMDNSENTHENSTRIIVVRIESKAVLHVLATSTAAIGSQNGWKKISGKAEGELLAKRSTKTTAIGTFGGPASCRCTLYISRLLFLEYSSSDLVAWQDQDPFPSSRRPFSLFFFLFSPLPPPISISRNPRTCTCQAGHSITEPRFRAVPQGWPKSLDDR